MAVILQFADLLAERDLGDDIYRAYGPQGLGALVIAGIPGYAEARARLLPMGHTLAHASESVKSALEDPESLWNAGWSHGKEKLGDKPDYAKVRPEIQKNLRQIYCISIGRNCRFCSSLLFPVATNITPLDFLVFDLS